MSLVEKLNAATSKKTDDPNFKGFFLLSKNADKVIEGMRKGSSATHEIQISDTFSLNFRLLTSMEEAAVKCFVDKILNEYPYAIDKGSREEVSLIENMKVKLVVASTPPMTVGSSLVQYNSKAQLTYNDASNLTLYELSYLIKEYQSLETRFNPSIELLSEADLAQLIDAIKKQSIALKDLSYSVLLGISTQLIQREQLEDKRLSYSL